MEKLRVGFATIDWTPEPGMRLQGQMHERIATHARDPLQVNTCALSDGRQEVILATVDVCMMPTDLVDEIKSEWAEASGLPADSLLIHTTHTHVAPALANRIICDAEPEAVKAVRKAIVATGLQARIAAVPVDVFSGTGYCEQLGWNRRAMFADGSSRMYGNSTQEGFTGLEGPRDGGVSVVYFKDEAGQCVGVLTGFATHPNCMEGECFYSADFPGEVRRQLKAQLGEHVGVLYFTGAAGNTAPSLLDPYVAEQPWRNDAGAKRSGQYFVGEVSKVLALPAEPMAPVLAKSTRNLRIPMRKWPAADEVAPGKWAVDYYSTAEKIWPELLEKEDPFPVRLSAVRVGDAVIATNPAELFVEFGLQIKEGSSASTTLISELTDGYCGYVPTQKAFSRGGYETWCAPSSRLVPTAGEEMVRSSLEMIQELFPDKS